jgi:fumarate reductase subunit C
MIDGITIIKTTSVNSASKNNWFPLSIFFILFSIVILIFVIYKLVKGKIKTRSFVVFTLIEICSIFLGTTLLLSSLHPYTWNEYTVKISDTVSFKQFTNKYHIVSQIDDTYVIVDKKEQAEYNS